MELTILVDRITSRLIYTFDFVFKLRGYDYRLVDSQLEYEASKGIKFCYTAEEEGIKSSQLLFDEEIKDYTIEKASFKDVEVLSFNGVSDPFASIFYVLTRYEEYVSTKRDQHGRFPLAGSLLKEYNWLSQAVCDRWALSIFDYLELDVLAIESPLIVPSFDIDNTYAYKLKTGKRKWLSVARDIVKFDFRRLRERLNVAGGGRDPYDTFEKILEINEKLPNTRVFWLVGELAEKDRNISIENKAHQDLIKRVGSAVNIGLHPSYASHMNREKLSFEKGNLEKVTGTQITLSRQHFLRFELPKSYQLLSSLGFKEEYSMGFAEEPGFRSGTARPHSWFDLTQNSVTDLIIHPFVYMDGTLNEYMKLSVEESKETITALYEEVCLCGGNFVFIWHNETIGGYGKWEGWSEVLKHTLDLQNE